MKRVFYALVFIGCMLASAFIVYAVSYTVRENQVSAYVQEFVSTGANIISRYGRVSYSLNMNPDKALSIGRVNGCVGGYAVSGATVYGIPLGNVIDSPNDEWVDCSYPYRKPLLYYFNSSVSNATFVFAVSDNNVIGNVSTGKEVIIAVDGVKVNFTGGKASGIRVKVGIKPSSFGGTGDYVMIKVNGTWVHPDNGSVESGSSGQIINATFTLGTGTFIINAVGMHHTGSGWSDPTTVYIWSSNGSLLHQYTASSHVWDNSIYDNTNYFEYVNIDNYGVNESVGGYVALEYHVYVQNITAGYHELYVYYGVVGVDNSLPQPPSGYTQITPTRLGVGDTQVSTAFCTSTTTTSTASTTTTVAGGGAVGGGGLPVGATVTAPSTPVTSSGNQGGLWGVLTITRSVHDWIVALGSNSSTRLLLGVLVVLGLLLLFAGSGKKGRRR